MLNRRTVFAIEGVKSALTAKRRCDGLDRMLGRANRSAKYRYDGVADIFVDKSAGSFDRFAHRSQIAVHHRNDLFRGHGLGKS